MLDAADGLVEVVVQRPALLLLEQEGGGGVLHEVVLGRREVREVGRGRRGRRSG